MQFTRQIELNEYQAMQLIKAHDPDATFWPSWLDDYDFCPNKLCLRSDGIYPPKPAEATIIGEAIHQSIQRSHDEAASPYEGRIEDTPETAASTKRGMTFSELVYRGGRIAARYDALWVTPNKDVYIIDNKIPPRNKARGPWQGHMNQVLAGALAWASVRPEYQTTLPLFAVLRDRDHNSMDVTTGWFWKERFTPKHASHINALFDTIAIMLCDHTTTPMEGVTVNKCIKCDYTKFHLCQRSLAHSERR